MENVVEPDRRQMTVWIMRIACRIPKVSDTHSEYVILVAFPLRQWQHKRPSVLRYTYIACLVPRSKHCLSLIKMNNLLPYREIIAVYSDILTK